MTAPESAATPGSGRTIAQIIAEAKADSQEPLVVEPFVLTLNTGRKVTFRNPEDITVEESENARPGFSGQLRLLLANSRDWRAVWAEVKNVEQRYVGALVDTILTYYEEQGKGVSSSS